MTPIPSLPNRAILSAEDRAMLALYITEMEQKTITEAASDTGIHPDILIALVRDGIIPGNLPSPTADGVCDIDTARDIASRLAAARQAVDGQGITATDAAEKYRFAKSSIHAWYRNHWIEELSTGKRNTKIYNEGDIAFARALADLRGQAAGKSVFPAKTRSGRPRKQ